MGTLSPSAHQLCSPTASRRPRPRTYACTRPRSRARRTPPPPPRAVGALAARRGRPPPPPSCSPQSSPAAYGPAGRNPPVAPVAAARLAQAGWRVCVCVRGTGRSLRASATACAGGSWSGAASPKAVARACLAMCLAQTRSGGSARVAARRRQASAGARAASAWRARLVLQLRPATLRVLRGEAGVHGEPVRVLRARKAGADTRQPHTARRGDASRGVRMSTGSGVEISRACSNQVMSGICERGSAREAASALAQVYGQAAGQRGCGARTMNGSSSSAMTAPLMALLTSSWKPLPCSSPTAMPHDCTNDASPLDPSRL